MRRAAMLSAMALAGGVLAAPPATGAPVTWVSGTGVDSGSTCPATAPCATLQYAHDRTDTSGTINVLSSGSFGALTITKSINVVAESGVTALIQSFVASCGAVCINASASSIVRLRGLHIDLNKAAGTGVQFNTGSTLHIENMRIRRVSDTHAAILLLAPGASQLHVTDTTVSDGAFGVFVWPQLGTAKVSLNRVASVNSNSTGFLLEADNNAANVINATIRDSVATGSVSGAWTFQGGTGTATMLIERSALINNEIGVRVTGAQSTIRMGESTVTGNSNKGLLVETGGNLVLYPTNKMEGNNDDATEPLRRRRRH